MKRRLAAPLLAALVLARVPLPAQEVLKPFNQGTPDKPAAANPAPPANPAAPLKPFRVEPAPGTPAPAEEAIPKAVPIKRPPASAPAAPVPQPAIPVAVPVTAPPGTPPPPASTPPPAVATSPAAPPRPANVPPADVVDSGDIVIRPGAATTADQVQLQLADTNFSRKLYREACAEYERYISLFPKAPVADRQAAHYRLAECYRLTDALNNARTNYELVLTNFPQSELNGLASYRLAEILYAEKDYHPALPQFRSASVRLTQPAAVNAAKFYVGRCLEALGEKAEARATYQELAGIAADNPFQDASRLSLGRLLIDGSRREDALKVLLPLSASTTNAQIKAEALARVGFLQLELGQPDASAATFAAALALPEIGTWKEIIRVALFRVLYDKKDYKTVLSNYARDGSTDLSADNKLNLLGIVANAHRELGHNKEALGIYEQIIAEYPATTQSRDAGYERLIILYNQDDARLLDEVNAFLTANPAAPQLERVSLMKAEALFKKNDFATAAPIYQELVEKSRQLSGNYKAEATFKLGWSYAQLRQFDQAVATFSIFLKNHPTSTKFPTALAQRGSANMQLKQYPAAQKDFEELASKYPKAKEREFALENLALVQSQLGDNAKMAATFELLLKDYPETAAKAKAHYWIGRAAFDNKNYKVAAQHLDQARKLDKDQYFERSSLAIMGCQYNLEDVDATSKEIESYKAQGGKAEAPTDVIRWLAQKYFERGEHDKAERYYQVIIARKEAVADDYHQLARSRFRSGKFKEAVAAFDSYLASVKDPAPRASGLIEKADAQLGLKDWEAVTVTVKEALTLQPEGKLNGEARLRAGDAQVATGALIEAGKIYEGVALTLDDEDVTPRALEKAIEVRRKLGANDDVARLENQLRSRYPEYYQRRAKVAKP